MLWFSTVTPGCGGRTIPVVEVAWLSLALEIDPMADPVAGTIRERRGPAQPFTGWTQLGRILGDIIAAHASGTAQATTTNPGGGGGAVPPLAPEKRTP